MTTALWIIAGLLAFDVLIVALLWTLGTLRQRHLRRHPPVQPKPLLDFSDAKFDWPSREPVQGHGFSRTGTTTWHHSTAGTRRVPSRVPYDREAA